MAEISGNNFALFGTAGRNRSARHSLQVRTGEVACGGVWHSENEERRRDLNRRLEKTGYRFVAVDACSPDRLHCECSVAVVMKQKEALALARVLEQVAFFWFDGSRFWILGAIAEADPLELPRRS
ncbi:MAG: hypothetical protein DMD72_12635 [Gemmatimonadetes bacterium]|nr:MAG: hypothetical protein DMD72_12635 [Gemmatimonadota bacterium]